MEALAKELNRRYEVATSKVGREFILGIRDYFILLQENEILQEMLAKEKLLPKEHYEYIWGFCQYFLQGVYYPMINQPEQVEKNFGTFFARDEEDLAPIDWLGNPKAWKGVFLRQRYIYRLSIIHRKLFAQLKDKQFGSHSTPEIKVKPKDKLRFIESEGLLIIDGQHIEIAKQENKQNNAHKILSHILVKNKNNISAEFPFADLAKSPLFEDFSFHFDKKSWGKYHNACREINKKILEKTGIPDFLLYGSSRRGTVRINPKYLETLGLGTKELG